MAIAWNLSQGVARSGPCPRVYWTWARNERWSACGSRRRCGTSGVEGGVSGTSRTGLSLIGAEDSSAGEAGPGGNDTSPALRECSRERALQKGSLAGPSWGTWDQGRMAHASLGVCGRRYSRGLRRDRPLGGGPFHQGCGHEVIEGCGGCQPERPPPARVPWRGRAHPRRPGGRARGPGGDRVDEAVRGERVHHLLQLLLVRLRDGGDGPRREAHHHGGGRRPHREPRLAVRQRHLDVRDACLPEAPDDTALPGAGQRPVGGAELEG